MGNSPEIVDDRVSSIFQTFSMGNLASAKVKRDDIEEKADAE